MNNRWGFLDSSLLGNFYYGCQTATNGREGSEAIAPYQGGGYGVMQPDAHAIISGCYSEGDQLPNYLPPVSSANVIGGLHPNGWCSNLPGQPFRAPGGSVQTGATHSRVSATKLETPELSLGDGISLKNTGQYGQGARIGIYDDSTGMLEVIGAGAPYAQFATPVSGQPLPRRSVPGKSIALYKAQWVNGELHIYGDTAITDVVFLYGDRIINDAWAEGEADYWRVVRPGRNQNLKPFAIQKAEHWYGDPALQKISLKDETGYQQLRVGDILNLGNGASGQVWDINTKYLVEVRRPASAINTGEQINFMGGWKEQLAPTEYRDSTLLLSFTPFEKRFTVGEKAVVDGLPTTVRSVRMEKGVQLVELNFPAGAQPDWFRAGNGIGWGAENVGRLPAYYDHSDPAHPTVTLSFPMPDLEAGAAVWINGQKTIVVKIYTPGIAVKALKGSVYANQPGSTFMVQQPGFRAF